MSAILPSRHAQLRLRAPLSRAEEICERFLCLGASGAQWLDDSCLDRPADLRENEVELRFSFTADEACRACREEGERLAAEDERIGNVSLVVLDSADWATAWRAHHRPVRAGRFFVHPEWVPAEGERYPIRIDPGMAFGTGLHPTTHMCLTDLDRSLPANRVLDLGCGSGVLALAAARAGVPDVWAVDIDPEACRVTRENAERNGLGDRLMIREGDVDAAPGRFDLVLANILSGPLMAMAPRLAMRVSPGGRVVLSGLLREEAAEVADAYRRAGFQQESVRCEEEWACLIMQRGGE